MELVSGVDALSLVPLASSGDVLDALEPFGVDDELSCPCFIRAPLVAGTAPSVRTLLFPPPARRTASPILPADAHRAEWVFLATQGPIASYRAPEEEESEEHTSGIRGKLKRTAARDCRDHGSGWPGELGIGLRRK